MLKAFKSGMPGFSLAVLAVSVLLGVLSPAVYAQDQIANAGGGILVV